MKIFTGVLALIVFTSIGGVVYYYNFYESPEQCFAKQIRAWGEKENLTDNIAGLIQEDTKMAVSRAKAITGSYEIAEMTTSENKKIYLQVRATFDYCGIK